MKYLFFSLFIFCSDCLYSPGRLCLNFVDLKLISAITGILKVRLGRLTLAFMGVAATHRGENKKYKGVMDTRYRPREGGASVA